MKKIIIFSVFVSISVTNMFSQTIDCQYLNPKCVDDAYNYIRFGSSSEYYAGLMHNFNNSAYGDGDDFSIFTYGDRDITLRPGNGNVILFPSTGGKVGIGTTNPSAKLHVQGGAFFNLGEGLHLLGEGSYYGTDLDARIFRMIDANGTNAVVDGGITFESYTSTDKVSKDILTLRGNGNVGIGTTNPSATLTVKGNILASKIEVKSDSEIPASDYVFNEDYNLRSLSEVEQFVKENKHLPEVPSATEFKKNGYSIGEMDDILLRKVEELTLYIIEMNSQLKIVQIENDRLMNEISSLKAEMQKLDPK
jgi:hypothetical protein